MTVVEMRRAVMEKVENMPEVKLRQLLDELNEIEETIDILSCKGKILHDNHEVFKKLAQ